MGKTYLCLLVLIIPISTCAYFYFRHRYPKKHPNDNQERQRDLRNPGQSSNLSQAEFNRRHPYYGDLPDPRRPHSVIIHEPRAPVQVPAGLEPPAPPYSELPPPDMPSLSSLPPLSSLPVLLALPAYTPEPSPSGQRPLPPPPLSQTRQSARRAAERAVSRAAAQRSAANEAANEAAASTAAAARLVERFVTTPRPAHVMRGTAVSRFTVHNYLLADREQVAPNDIFEQSGQPRGYGNDVDRDLV